MSGCRPSAMSANEYSDSESQEDYSGEEQANQGADNDIVTTEAEKEAFLIVKSIMRQVVDPSRVAMRDKKSYCGVLLDDNNRKPICRLYLETSNWYLGVFDSERNEEKIPIESLDDIFNYTEKLKELPESYGV